MYNENGITIVKIAITGGPCSGKSTAKSWINDEFSKRGWRVYLVAETATMAAEGNANAHEFESLLLGQTQMFFIQRATEHFFEEIARINAKPGDKILIVCDRGTVDAFAFLNDSEAREFVALTGENRLSMMSQYDAVFHLVSAAVGAREYYTLENNSARRETPEQAAEVDRKTMQAWTGHPHLRIIDNSTDFKDKMMRLLNEIAAFAGESRPYEMERRYLIKKPDMDSVSGYATEKNEIIQFYLTAPEGIVRRLRQRGDAGIWTFTLTERSAADKGKIRVETEHRITEKEYLNLLSETDISLPMTRKTRWAVSYGSLYYEIDVFPFSDDLAIMTVELSPDAEPDIPPFIEVVREVTDDPLYHGRGLARAQSL